MDFPILINWTSPFPISVRKCGSDQVLHCLLRSHRMDTRLIWVNDVIWANLLFEKFTNSPFSFDCTECGNSSGSPLLGMMKIFNRQKCHEI